MSDRKHCIVLENEPIQGSGVPQSPSLKFDPSLYSFGPNERRKLIFIGSFSVGKSALASRIVHDDFAEGGKATIGADQLSISVSFAAHIIKINVWDTSGDERYADITTTYYRGADTVIICFDLTDKNSFNDISKWKDRVDNLVTSVPILLVGCKADMDNRKVTREEALQKAKSLGLEYFETSAKEKINTTELAQRAAFLTITHSVVEPVQRVVFSSDDHGYNGSQKNKKCC